MKYTSLLSICSVLTLTTISFSQETVMTGIGGGSSGFGEVDVDVPEEEQQNDCPGDNNDEVNQNDGHHDEESQDDPVDSPNNEESTPSENTKLTIPNQGGSIAAIRYSWFSLYQPEGHWIRSIRERETIKGDPREQSVLLKPVRKRFVLRGGNCPRGSATSTQAQEVPTHDDNKTYPRSYACDCCCHLSKGGSIDLTTNSDDWDDIYDDSSSNDVSHNPNGKYGNQSDDRFDSSGKDDQNGYEDVPCGRGNDDRQSTNQGKQHDHKKRGGSCDNKDGQDKSYDEWSDDDCECTCNCKRFGEVVIYD